MARDEAFAKVSEEKTPEGIWEKPVPHDEAYPAYPERTDLESFTPETIETMKAAGLL